MSPGRGSGRAIEVLSRLVNERGAPKQLRWDNGSWRVVLKWLVDQGIDIGFRAIAAAGAPAPAEAKSVSVQFELIGRDRVDADEALHEREADFEYRERPVLPHGRRQFGKHRINKLVHSSEPHARRAGGCSRQDGVIVLIRACPSPRAVALL